MTVEATVKVTLEQQLLATRAYMASVAPAEALNVIEKDIEWLTQTDAARSVLGEGAIAPDFSLPNIKGQNITLANLVAKGPVVLVFYRGEWCRYCNVALRNYQAILSQIQELGATLVAVSPQTPDHSLSLAEKAELRFEVLSDKGNQVARSYGLVFQVGALVRPVLQSLGADVAQFNGDESWELPIPGTFVIGQDSKIRLAFADSDFRNRLEPDKILEALAEIAQS